MRGSWLALICLALSPAPVLAQASGAAKAVFSHLEHLDREKALRCTDCHDPEHSRPALKKDRCTQCHEAGQTTWTEFRLKSTARPLQVFFPHQEHASSHACLTCHGRTAADEQQDGSTVLRPEECVACHKERQSPVKERDCTHCHNEPKDLPEHPEHIPFRLPHKKHMSKVFCGSCHREETLGPGTHGRLEVQSKRCFACHQEQKKGARPDECAKCHGQEVKVRERYRRLQAIFPHSAHASGEAKLTCDICHLLPGDARATHGEISLTPEACLECHADNGRGPGQESCDRCHGVNQRKVKPFTHDGSWRTRHGEAARFAMAGEHGDDCATCHRADTCQTCHRLERPKSHTGFWRERGHARVAGWDRDSCKVCHEQGQCVHCHTTTKPLNHAGAWRSLHGLAAESRTNEQCLACHRPSDCMDCHGGKTR